MSSTRLLASPGEPAKPTLEPGDHLDQKTFHELYEQTPQDVKAELIEGVVYMPSPLRVQHGDVHGDVMCWLKLYGAQTPAVRAVDNATTILGEFSEPQPDGSLLIRPEHGGQTRIDDKGYLVGAPELIGEVSLSSVAIDLHAKRRDYERAGVREYVVFILREYKVVWFVRGTSGFVPLDPGADGIFRSPLFGGLWLDADAVLRGETAQVQRVLHQGLASPEHAQFLQRWPRR